MNIHDKYAYMDRPKNILKPLIISCSLCFMLSVTSARAQDFNDGAVAPAGNSDIQKQAENVLTSKNLPSIIPLAITLDEVALVEKAALQKGKDGPLKIGFGRQLPDAYQEDLQSFLEWEVVDNKEVTAVTVTSPAAKAIRIALNVDGLPESFTASFFSKKNANQVFGPYTAQELIDQSDADTNIYWSPVIDGDAIGIEFVIDADNETTFPLRIEQVSHIVYSVVEGNEKNLADIGNSGSCNIDVRCRVTSNTRNSTAKIVFTKSGSSFLCTGTLLNDKDANSWIPYFMTANHCVSSQAVANTINSFWRFERATCGGAAPTSVIQRTGGAELLKADAGTDFSFLQLNDQIDSISGNWFSGWHAGQLAQNSTVVGIHHPSGDLKKWSHGSMTGFAPYLGNVNGSGKFLRVIWSLGTTEGGSSGSALFDTQNRFRGNLYGGYASCSASGSPDWYGRFDLTYPSVKQWINDGAKALSSAVPISGSVGQGKWKEYKINASSINGMLKVDLYGLSNDADLYVRKGTRATRSRFDCRSSKSGTATDSCTLSNSGNVTYYIGVRGFSAGTTSFKLRATLSPGATQVISPTGEITDTTPTYRWNAVPGATWYYLYVRDASGVRIRKWHSASTAGCASGTGVCSVTMATSLVSGKGRWWVRTWNSAGYGPWSGGLNFIVAIPPAATTLIAPAGSISDNTPTYRWNAVPGATWYYMYLRDSSGVKIRQWFSASSAGCSSGAGVCSVTPTTVLAPGSGRWWIKTWNSYGYGPWSGGLSFNVQ